MQITVKGQMDLNNRITSFNQTGCAVELTITTDGTKEDLARLKVNGKRLSDIVIKDGNLELTSLQRLVTRRVEHEFDYMVTRSHQKTEDELLRPDFEEDH